MRFLLCALLVLAALASRAAEIRGKVTNAVGGETLGQVEVSVLGTKCTAITSPDGDFTISDLPPGDHRLRLNAVSYRLLTIPFSLATNSDIKEFSITMVPDNFHHADRVEVRGDLFQVSDSPAITEMNLTSSEIRQTSTVFADDPSRADAAGAFRRKATTSSSPNSGLGAPFANVAVYVDDVLVLNRFMRLGTSARASLGVLKRSGREINAARGVSRTIRRRAAPTFTRDGSRSAPLFRIWQDGGH
jgi:hypothetical protein